MPRKIGFTTYSETFSGANFTDEEWGFVRAMAAYQKRWKRRYPSWREALHVLLCLGYRKVAAPQPFADPTPGEVELTRQAKADPTTDSSQPANGPA